MRGLIYYTSLEVFLQMRAAARVKLQELKESGDEAWDETEIGLEEAWRKPMNRSAWNRLRISGPASVMIIFLVTLQLPGCRLRTSPEVGVSESNVTLPTPAHAWAKRITKPGLPNLYRVSDDLYRGAQPTTAGFRELQDMGMKTVINLRYFFSDREAMAGTDLAYEEIPMKAWHSEDEDVIRFLQLVSDPDRGPFFIHCHHGADRTGLLSAVYRIVIQGWTRDEAIVELTRGGFGFHPMWHNLVKYLRDLDVEKLRRQAFPKPTSEKIGFKSDNK